MGDTTDKVDETTTQTPNEETNAPNESTDSQPAKTEEEQAPAETKPDETQQESPESQKETAETQPGQEENSEGTQRKPRIERRFDKLTGKLKQTVEENQRLREQQQLKQQAQEPDQQEHRNNQDNERLRRLEETILLDKVSNELNTVQSNYPELNPDSPDYDPNLAETITETVEEEIFQKGNFEIRPTVDRMMKLVNSHSKKVAARTQQAVNEDAKRSGVPAGSTGKQSGPQSYDEIRQKYPIGTPEYKEAVQRYIAQNQ